MRALSIWLMILIGAPALADRQSFPPVDQADTDPSLIAFRDDLLAKVAARDTDAVVAAACPDIHVSHSAETGPEAFRSNLTQTSENPPDDSGDQADTLRDAYWAALQDTLASPGYFDDQGEFWMPHQWRITLPARLDPALAYFVTGTNVSLRQAPSQQAAVLAPISHEVVLVPDYRDTQDYQPVRLTDGTSGYMHRDFLWSMVGYRAALVKSDAGDWQICTFVSGD
ncbi:MAG: SH3 domain-containing protein [Pseudomonadota bacterium]